MSSSLLLRHHRSTVLLLLISSSLSGFTAHGKSSCKSSGDSNNLDLRDPSLAWKTVTYDRVDQDGYLFRTDSGTLLLDAARSVISPHSANLSSFRNDSSSSKLPGLYIPWGYIWYGGTFRLTFNMSVYSDEPSAAASSRNNNLILAILPGYDFNGGGPNQPMAIHPADDSWSSGQQDGSSSSSLLQMGACTWPVYGVSTGCLKIPIDPAAGSSVVESFVVYDPLGKRLSASVGEAARNPDAPYAVAASMAMDLSQLMSGDDRLGQIGLFSSVGQLAQLQAWNLTVDRPLPKGGGPPWVVILSSVLGSVAATAVVAAAVYLYLNSRYRRWKKDLDQLAKTMQSLPGVPLQVDFAVINKATNNFSEMMKLGKGGFGAVYRCTLPAPAPSTRTTTMGQAMTMKVAVKKFTRDLSDRRYEDFLAEVSIINRLRHKNVVPLVGWSYNKGEPLLIYEYMENGSLDQHLFNSGASGGHRWRTEAIGQWDTRYGIARDIATGLHYIHHEHEPMVLHRDIKASNIMLDSAFCARLGDFGIACTVAPERSSVTGFAGTIGYIAPECVIKWKATRQTDVYAFGVLVLELVSGKKNSSADIPADDGHISYWVWRLHREGTLLEAMDASIISGKNHQPRHVIEEEAKRLLLLGLACTNPNPSSRPSMTEVVQVINKVAPPPEVSLERPTLGWMPEDEECSSTTQL